MTRRGSLLMDTSPLQVLKPLAVRLGINEAVALQQLHYLLIQTKGAAVEMTRKQWRREHLPWLSEATIRRVFASLRERGLVVVEQAGGSDRTTRYAIDYDVFDALEADYRATEQIVTLDQPDRQVGRGQSERFHTGATEGPKAEQKQQEQPSVSPFTEDFRGWLSHHWATTSIDPPAEGSKVWRDTLWAYTKARESGFGASQLEMAVEGAWNSEWYRGQGFADPLSMLADKGLGKRAEAGREHRAKATTPAAAKTDWDAWVAEQLPDLDGYLADVAAFKAAWLESSGTEVTVENVRAAIERSYSLPETSEAA